MRGFRGEMYGKGMGLAPGFWFRAFVLSSLKKREFYGYELLNMIDEYFPGFCFCKGPSGMGTGYRILRMLEMEGLIKSRWETGEGPAKRIYSITPEGERFWEELMNYIKGIRESIDKFIDFLER